MEKFFLPYDELKLSFLSNQGLQSVYEISAPWFTRDFVIDETEPQLLQKSFDRYREGLASEKDLKVLSNLLKELAEYPLAYHAPRLINSAPDQHRSLGLPLDDSSPRSMLMDLLHESPREKIHRQFSQQKMTKKWSWDIRAALDFSATPSGFDPESLFSVARVFHYTHGYEENKTDSLNSLVLSLKDQETQFRQAAAIIIKQNHYVTQHCKRILTSAMTTAQSSRNLVEEFMTEENGHDLLLKRALSLICDDPSEVPLQASVITLIEVFVALAKRNFLAFTMLLDIFERSTYTEEDPFATTLKAGGQFKAAEVLNKHFLINEEGDHENVALGFLVNMASVDRGYAEETLRLMEMVTAVVYEVSKESIELIETQVLRNCCG